MDKLILFQKINQVQPAIFEYRIYSAFKFLAPPLGFTRIKAIYEKGT